MGVGLFSPPKYIAFKPFARCFSIEKYLSLYIYMYIYYVNIQHSSVRHQRAKW